MLFRSELKKKLAGKKALHIHEYNRAKQASIARDIARNHGGDVRLETSPLGGLRALIRLPV